MSSKNHKPTHDITFHQVPLSELPNIKSICVGKTGFKQSLLLICCHHLPRAQKEMKARLAPSHFSDEHLTKDIFFKCCQLLAEVITSLKVCYSHFDYWALSCQILLVRFYYLFLVLRKCISQKNVGQNGVPSKKCCGATRRD